MAVDLDALRREQAGIAARVDLRFDPSYPIGMLAGVDVSFSRYSTAGYAAVVVFSYPFLQMVDCEVIQGPLPIPYIPGYLAFREWPLIQACLQKLRIQPDLLICDGQGLAHPGRAGLACHVGVATGKMAIGCAKSRLIGEYEEPGWIKGARSDLRYEGQKVGEVLRTRDGIKPLFISPGHKIDFEHASQLILSLCPRYRQPIPIRAAHALVNRARKQDSSSV